MTSVPEWLEMVPAARRLGISVRQLYDAVDQFRIDARWVREPLLHLEVAVDANSVERLSTPAG